MPPECPSPVTPGSFVSIFEGPGSDPGGTAVSEGAAVGSTVGTVAVGRGGCVGVGVGGAGVGVATGGGGGSVRTPELEAANTRLSGVGSGVGSWVRSASIAGSLVAGASTYASRSAAGTVARASVSAAATASGSMTRGSDPPPELKSNPNPPSARQSEAAPTGICQRTRASLLFEPSPVTRILHFPATF